MQIELDFFWINVQIEILTDKDNLGMNKETKTICLNFKKDLEEFTDSVNSLTKQESLSNQEAFLSKMAETIHKLYHSSVEIIDCDEKDIQEIGKLVQNIFSQPLTTKEKKQLTIINAIKSFSSQPAQKSDLSTLISQYIDHPETTKSFIRELELLSEDLNLLLSQSA